MCSTPPQSLGLSSFQSPAPLPVLAEEIHDAMQHWEDLSSDSRLTVLAVLEEEGKNQREAMTTERQLRLQNRVKEELLESEENFLRQMETLQTYFLNPLEDKCLLPRGSLSAISADTESIIRISKQLLHDLRRYPDDTGNVFLHFSPFLRCYSGYAASFVHVSTMLQNTRGKNPLEQMLRSQETRPEVQQKIEALLVAPLQRLPRYKLLLQQFENNLPNDHSEQSRVAKASKAVGEVAHYVESRLELTQAQVQLIRIQKALKGGKPAIVQPGQRLLCEGPILQLQRRWARTNRRQLILTTQFLLICRLRTGKHLGDEDSLDCRRLLPLRHCTVLGIMGRGLFKVRCHQDEVIFCAATPEDGKMWQDSICEAIKDAQECNQTLRKESSRRVPLRGAAIALLARNESISKLLRLRRKEKHERSTTLEVTNQVLDIEKIEVETVSEREPPKTPLQRVLLWFRSKWQCCSRVTNEQDGTIITNRNSR